MKRKSTRQRKLSLLENLEPRQMMTVVPMLLADIREGQTGSGLFRDFTEFNGELFFSADNGTSGRELWKTDGTTDGTTRVRDINAGLGSSSPGAFTPYNGELYFSAADSSTGAELWKTDGSSGGTERVADIFGGTNGSFPTDLTLSLIHI